jgi:drug/metabolite transporter (DMT)-like permease
VLFGTAWPVMKVGLADATPIWFAVARAGLGTVASFLLLAALGRLARPRRADLPIIFSIGILQLTFFFAFSTLGLRLVPAGRSVLLAYTTSLWLVPLAALSGERIGVRRIAGALAGLAGVAVLLEPQHLSAARLDILLGYGFLLLAALSWALAIFHARRHVWQLSPLQVLPWQMLLATVLLTGLAAIVEPHGHILWTTPELLSLAYVGIVAGPLGSWGATSAARALPTVTSSVGFLGVPLLGVVVSTLWLGEPISASLIVGGLLVLAGLALVVTAPQRRMTSVCQPSRVTRRMRRRPCAR